MSFPQRFPKDVQTFCILGLGKVKASGRHVEVGQRFQACRIIDVLFAKRSGLDAKLLLLDLNPFGLIADPQV